MTILQYITHTFINKYNNKIKVCNILFTENTSIRIFIWFQWSYAFLKTAKIFL